MILNSLLVSFSGVSCVEDTPENSWGHWGEMDSDISHVFGGAMV